ncbi:MAG: MarR family transcriptional regulator [Nocardiopsaceae bacterium]|nr:MarR family transcriptional regulator [Nocardiopsaceae bacterium]
MASSPDALLPILRSPRQGELLAWLFLDPDEGEYSTSDLARRLGVSQPTISREADRLAASGLITERRYGRLRLLRANMDTPIARPLTDLLAVSYGPLPVLAGRLAPIHGIEHAFIYGSWAARHQGEPGPVPRDVDVLVVGDADIGELYDAAQDAERILRREVNVRQVSPEAWAHERAAFLETVRSRPLTEIPLQRETAR